MPSSSKFTDTLLELLAIVGILAAFTVILIFYKSLPDSIPSHFTFSGKPDDFSGKESIWLFTVFGVLQYIMLTVITFFMKILKRPDDLTTEVLSLVYGMMLRLKLMFSYLSLYLVSGTILIARGKADSLGAASTPVMLLLIATILVSYIFRIIRKQKVNVNITE
jgi:hypothetical protein